MKRAAIAGGIAATVLAGLVTPVVIDTPPPYEGLEPALDTMGLLALPKRDGPLAVIGDLQGTGWAERKVLKREDNRAERQRLVNDLTAVSPAAVAIVGDLVFAPSRDAHWRTYDALVLPLLQQGVPILPAMGNHDYYCWATGVLPCFVRRPPKPLRTRFPWLAIRTHYAAVHGGLGLVWLDSERLAGRHGTAQADFLRRTLQSFRGSGVKAALVFTHRPPYSNSEVVGGHKRGQQVVVPVVDAATSASDMPVIVVSGHAHGFEYFTPPGRAHFVVSAGGGGPRQRLKSQPKYTDDQYSGGVCPNDKATPAMRPLNYLLITEEESFLEVEARGLCPVKPGGAASPIRVIHSVRIAF